MTDNDALEAGEDTFVLSDVEADKTVYVSVPHSDASAFHAMVSTLSRLIRKTYMMPSQRVNITVEYTTLVEPDVNRSLTLVRVVLTSLPLAINVEDFFRGTRYFTYCILDDSSHLTNIELSDCSLASLCLRLPTNTYA